MDAFPPEIATPPLALVALLGDPESTAPVAEYLRSAHRPPCNTVSACDPLAGAAELFGQRRREGEEEEEEDDEEASTSSSAPPPPGIFKAGWFAKHRQRVPAVAALFLRRGDVTGDPGAWARVMQAVDVVRASCKSSSSKGKGKGKDSSSRSSAATPARLVLVVCGSVTGDGGSNAPPPLPEDRMAGLCRQGCLPLNNNNVGSEGGGGALAAATATAATATTGAPSPPSSSSPHLLPSVVVYSPQAEGPTGARRIARLLHEHARAFYAEDAAARKKEAAAEDAAAALAASSAVASASSREPSVVVAAASLAGSGGSSSSSSSLSALGNSAGGGGAPVSLSRPLSPVSAAPPALSLSALPPSPASPSSAAALSAARELKAGALAEFRGDWRGAEGHYRAAHEALMAAAAAAGRELEEEEAERDAPASPPTTVAATTGRPPPPSPPLPPSHRRQALAEIAAVAEIAHLKRATLLLHQRRGGEAASAFAAHLRAFKAAAGGTSRSEGKRQQWRSLRHHHPGSVAATQAWIERQHAAFADLLSLPVVDAGAAAAAAAGAAGGAAGASSAARARHLVAAPRPPSTPLNSSLRLLCPLPPLRLCPEPTGARWCCWRRRKSRREDRRAGDGEGGGAA